MVRKLLGAICLVAVMVTLCGCVEVVEYKGDYTVTASLYIPTPSEGTQIGFISSSDLATSRRLVDTYIVILKSDNVLDEVAKQLNREDLSAEKLRGMISAEASEESEIIHIKVTHEDKALAKEIANAMLEAAPAAIEEIIPGVTVKIIEPVQ